MDFNFVLDYLMSNLEGVEIKGDKIVARCPICGDSAKSKNKKRFILKYDTDEDIYYRCWNCYMSDNRGDGHFVELYAFLEHISTKEAINRLYSLKAKFNNVKTKIVSKKPTKCEFETINNTNINVFNYIREDAISIYDEPKGFIDKKYIDILNNFKNSRQINTEILYAYKGQYKNRIIIPIIDNNNIIYFQARRTNETDYPKYLNPSTEKQSIILNKNNFNNEKNIIITEGIIDALSVGNQGTTCLGASITDDFIDKLMLLTDQNIIIALDNDETGLQSVLNLIETSIFSSKIQYFVFDDKFKEKDINELLINQKISNMYEFISNNAKQNYSAAFFIKNKLKRLRAEKNNEDNKVNDRLLGDRWNKFRCSINK